MRSAGLPDGTVVDLDQATVVAAYGELPALLASVIAAMQSAFARAFPASYAPRPMSDLHGTVIGLERGSPACDLPGLLASLASSFSTPLRVQFGGFDSASAFRSRGSSPYDRTVWSTGSHLTLIGWPVSSPGSPRDSLSAIRSSARDFGFEHKHGVDGDFFVTLGDFTSPVPLAALHTELARWRYELGQEPLFLDVPASSVRVAAYQDPRLPAATTRTWPLPA